MKYAFGIVTAASCAFAISLGAFTLGYAVQTYENEHKVRKVPPQVRAWNMCAMARRSSEAEGQHCYEWYTRSLHKPAAAPIPTVEQYIELHRRVMG